VPLILTLAKAIPAPVSIIPHNDRLVKIVKIEQKPLAENVKGEAQKSGLALEISGSYPELITSQ
jgi:hypothetical protein